MKVQADQSIVSQISPQLAAKILSSRPKVRRMNPKSLENLTGYRKKMGLTIEPVDHVGDEKPKNDPGNSISDAMRRLLATPCPVDKHLRLWREVLAEAALEMAIDKPEAMRIVLDRLEGKPIQTIAGPGGGPIETRTVIITKEDLQPTLEALVACGAVKVNTN